MRNPFHRRNRTTSLRTARCQAGLPLAYPGPARGHIPWKTAVALPLLVGFASTTALLYTLKYAPLPDTGLANPTTIENANGTRLAEWTVRGTRQEALTLDEIPKALQHATLAVEDERFYQHHAFDLISTMRALIVDVSHGRVVQGGSTITQQLAKNLFLNQHRTFTRKLREALYAMQLELHESKPTILNQYLNVVYYGHGAYGVGAASALYFGKPAQQLDLAESAMLAGLPKGPTVYSPLDHFAAAKARQRVVLQRMVKARYVTADEAAKAYAEPIQLTKVHDPLLHAPYFTGSAIREVSAKYHLSEDDLYRGNVTIHTTLDPVLQKAAEHAVASTLPAKSQLQVAVVALDPQTGAIRAMVGGRDFEQSQYNRVFSERQPGSTFKGMLYAAALEQGWSPAHRINSVMTTFLYDREKTYTVHDYGDFYAHRPLTLREAIARSDNVYAVTTNLEVGPEEVMKTAHAMGIETKLKPFPSMALGVFPTSPLQLATAYASLANGGYRVTPYAVENVDGGNSRHNPSTAHRDRVISPEVSFEMSDLLRGVLQPGGTGYRVHGYLHGPASAKSGTTNTDAWMVGYTPRLVCAVWVGYDDNRAITVKEQHLAAPIWAKLMGTAQQRLPSRWYTAPADLVKRTIDPATGELATNACADTETDYFPVGSAPTAYCHLHTQVINKPDEKHWPIWFPNWLHGTR